MRKRRWLFTAFFCCFAALLCCLTSISKVKAEDSYTVTYHANGGTFEDGSDTNVVTYGPPVAEKITKTSKTNNVSDDGSSYSGGYGDNKAITDKVTIPGAKELKVTITYATESTNYDWVCVYDGKTTPSESNYSSSLSGKLGGSTKTTKTITVTGDTAQFFFRSDGSGSNYYGYYAVVEGTGTVHKVLSGTYQEPTTAEKDMKFGSWYMDKGCAAGNEFDPENVTKSQDVYAKYVESVIAKGTAGTTSWTLYDKGLLKIYPTNGTSGTLGGFGNMNHAAPWDSYHEQIKSVEFEKGVKSGTNISYLFHRCANLVSINFNDFDVSNATNMVNMFRGCSELTNLDIGSWDTGNVTGMSCMFSGCNKLTNLDIGSWNTGNVTDMSSMFTSCNKLTNLDIGSWNTSNVTDMSCMFYFCESLTSLDIGGWNVSNVTDMSCMFSGCNKLTSLEIGGWNTGNVTRMDSMFSNCSKLTSLEIGSWDTGNVTRMDSMFYFCESLTSLDIGGWNTGNVTDMGRMFFGCSKLERLDIGDWNTSKVTDMQWMFYICESLTSLDIGGWNTSNVTKMNSMFSNCINLTSLDIGGWNTGNVTKMNSMFSSCSKLTNLDVSGWNTSKVTDMDYMFSSCSKLTNLDVSRFNTSNVTNMKAMFYNCRNLTSLDASGFDTSKVTSMNSMFQSCAELQNLDIGSWDTGNVTDIKYMFNGYNKLSTIRLSDKIKSNIISQLPSKSWLHTRTIDGAKLYDKKTLTTSELAKLSGAEMSGTWKVPYTSSTTKNPDGTYEYVTDDDLWTRNGNTWTYTFDVFNDSVPFYFWEENLQGFSSELMPKSDGLLSKVGTTGKTKVGTVTNKQTLDSGNLKISKTVASGNTNAKFKFIITLTGDHIKDACEYSDVLFTKGTGIIYLKDGESKTVSGIPAGTTYSVSEEQTGLYQSQGENTSGIIEKDQTKEVSFTNTELKDNPPAENTEVNVAVSKKVFPKKNKETGKYQMSAAFTGLRANTSYGLSNGTEFTSDANGNGYTEFTLAQGEELVFLHLPVGCTYQLTEAAGDYISSYEVTDDQSAGTIAKNTDRNTEEKKALSTGKETAEAGENVKVTFTNEIQYLQKLTLEKKTVKADGGEYDCKESFDFTITFSNLKPGQSFASTVGKVKADEDGNAEKTISLKNGEKAEFYKIPYGTEYQITEEKNKYAPSYRIDAATVKKTTDKASADTDLSTETETIDMGEDDAVTFTNEYLEQFTLPDAGSNTLELLTGVAFFALLIGYANRKQLFCKKTK